MRGAETWTMSSTSSTVIARRDCTARDAPDSRTTMRVTGTFMRQAPELRNRTTYNRSMDKDFEVVILSACRTPIGSFGGAFKDLSAVDLGTVAIREAMARAGVNP